MIQQQQQQQLPTPSSAPCLWNSRPLLFLPRQNWTIFIFSLLNSERVYTLHYLIKSVQPSSFAARLTSGSLQSDAKTFNCSKCSQRRLFLCLSRLHILIYHVCVFKMSAFGTCVWHTTLVNRYLNAVPNVYLHHWRASVMHQTNYPNNVTMTPVSGRKINKHTKTYKTCDMTWNLTQL